ncbi:Uncharacterized protein TCAP_04565 [Tolypocladium capitatum]|uniref:Uncharacterized protein n=1 Tax=Tolypocladium capitatum TaxID=45235 RepID=A0A2K3QD90_9HYPO|nr:Uncharacterized protein TCAP_04565 [Tolypocladium capitatum]
MFMRTLVLGGLATIASAHIKMSNPVPFDQANLDNSPLLPDGSNFPCKGSSYALGGASNVFKQGSTQQLAFIGSAVHGGGSCQVSVTTDLKPTKSSAWKVIKSIEGGCPAQGQDGNMGGGASAAVPFKYDFTIPNELAAGNYTLAWTWFNKIGNREMYMNCAPLSVTGSGGSSGFMSTLPDMFVANVGNSCGTVASKDLVFPNPGKDVDQLGGITAAAANAAPTGAGCQQGNGGGNPPASGAPPPPAAPTSVAGNAPGPSGYAPPPQTTDAGGVFVTASSQQATATPAVSSAPEPAPSIYPPPSPPSSSCNGGGKQPSASGNQPSGGGSQPSGGFAPGTPCTPEGSWNCIGGTSFQRCASGAWSAVQGVAAGVTCTPGQSDVIQMNNAGTRRAMRRALSFAA